ncbi:hypothetical protein [Chondrinema litorale]|uniref:hypothetical protein n=1 Tax=Chondrinema litorale TaxID=2994555 RepID=UPI0025433D3E|nr:hypothetical protein [Chondrinema litorale]UZR99399.1 hypothetical protein OQ292_36050 [Chondrinema litorale]
MNNSFDPVFLLNTSYNDIKESDYWVHPNAGGISIGLSLENAQKVEIVISSRDFDDYIPEDDELPIPGCIYINDHLIELNSKEEQWVIMVLQKMLDQQKFGIPESLGAYTVNEVISFYSSDQALIFREKLLKG